MHKRLRVAKTFKLPESSINTEGQRELIGMQVAIAKTVASRTEFFCFLKARSLNEVYRVPSDTT